MTALMLHFHPPGGQEAPCNVPALPVCPRGGLPSSGPTQAPPSLPSRTPLFGGVSCGGGAGPPEGGGGASSPGGVACARPAPPPPAGRSAPSGLPSPLPLRRLAATRGQPARLFLYPGPGRAGLGWAGGRPLPAGRPASSQAAAAAAACQRGNMTREGERETDGAPVLAGLRPSSRETSRRGARAHGRRLFSASAPARTGVGAPPAGERRYGPGWRLFAEGGRE